MRRYRGPVFGCPGRSARVAPTLARPLPHVRRIYFPPRQRRQDRGEEIMSAIVGVASATVFQDNPATRQISPDVGAPFGNFLPGGDAATTVGSSDTAPPM